MRVRIFDQALNLIGEIDNYESLWFSRSWYGVGEFSIQMNWNKLYADELVKGRIIMVGNYPDSIGIITGVRKTVGGEGKGSETVTATGSQLKHILKWRIVYPPAGLARYEDSAPVESVMKALVTAQAGSGAAAARQLPLLDIAADGARGANYLISARYSNLMDELSDASYATHISPTLSIDTIAKRFTFDIAEGTDRRASQSVNGRAIFSPAFDTISDAEVLHSDADFRSAMIVGGQGVGAARTIVTVYEGTEPEGFDRREQWIDARDLATVPELTERGEAKAEEYANEDFVSATALTYSALRYRQEYDLGDLCTVSAFGEAVDARISEARESWSNGEYSVELTFGKPFPTLADKVAASASEAEATLNANE